MQFFAIFHSTDFFLLVLCDSTRLAKLNGEWGVDVCGLRFKRYFNNKTVLFMRLFFTHSHKHAYPNFSHVTSAKCNFCSSAFQGVSAADAYRSCLCSYLVLHLSAGTFTRACVYPHEAVTGLMVVPLLQQKWKVRFYGEKQRNPWEEHISHNSSHKASTIMWNIKELQLFLKLLLNFLEKLKWKKQINVPFSLVFYNF